VETWLYNPGCEIPAVKSWLWLAERRNNDEGIMEKEQWNKNLGEGTTEKTPRRRNHGGGIHLRFCSLV